MKRKQFGIGILILVLILLVLFNPGLGFKIRSFFGSGIKNYNTNELVLKNQLLESELVLLKGVRDSLPSWKGTYIPAVLYSQYPFNLKDEILLGAGKNQGVDGGEAVVLPAVKEGSSLTSGGILVGRVEETRENASLATTIFNGKWRSEIKIGDKGVEALLQGGIKPEITLIKKEAEVKDGDLVYNTDSRFIYGIPLGYLKGTRMAPDRLLKEADLDVGYDLGQIQSLLIVK